MVGLDTVFIAHYHLVDFVDSGEGGVEHLFDSFSSVKGGGLIFLLFVHLDGGEETETAVVGVFETGGL